MANILPMRVFTLDIGDKPLLTFEGKNLRGAYEICREEWLLQDIQRLSSNGVALWDGQARLRVRYASETEADFYRNESTTLQFPEDDLTLVYLVKLDANVGRRT